MKTHTIILNVLFLAALSFLFNCDDTTGNDPYGSLNQGVYTELEVDHSIFAGNPDTIYDGLTAFFLPQYETEFTFDDPIPAGGVSCNEYDLKWEDAASWYWLPGPGGFLGSPAGETFTFTVTAGGQVPELTTSIVFPSTEPVITKPVDMAYLSGFTVVWINPAGSGTIKLCIISSTDMYKIISLEVPDTGSYTLTESELSVFTPGTHVMLLEKINRKNIKADGYDNRSTISASYTYETLIVLQNKMTPLPHVIQ